MTDFECDGRESTRWRIRKLLWLRWMVAVVAFVTVSTGIVSVAPRVAGASKLSNERAMAAILYRQTQDIYGRINVMGEKYDLVQITLSKIKNEIMITKNLVGAIEHHVVANDTQLRADAIFAYVTNGAQRSNSTLFTSSPARSAATNVYNQIAEGNVNNTLSRLKRDQIKLSHARSILTREVRRAAGEVALARQAFLKAQKLERSLQYALSQVKGQIAIYFRQQQAAAAAAAARAARIAAAAAARAHQVATEAVARGQQPPAVATGFPAPPPDSRANIAIRAALSLIGVPYVWGGASRSGVDCSGLVMLAYEAAGIYLPHYSGAQFLDTVRVPLYDLQPGDILFYGYQGDTHEAIYIGHDKMIQAEQTGTLVQITPLWLGDSSLPLAGIGRPRG